MFSTTEHALGTSVTIRYPWGTYISAQVMCPDMKVRTVKRIALCADTFFSVPCSVTFKGKTVAGYLTIADVDSNDYNSTERYAQFVPYQYRKNGKLFSGGK